MNDEEIWLPVVGAQYHEVSNHYRVRSLDRLVEQGNGWGTGRMVRPVKGRILKQRPGINYGSQRGGRGDLYVTLSLDGGQLKHCKVKDLVEAAFGVLV